MYTDRVVLVLVLVLVLVGGAGEAAARTAGVPDGQAGREIVVGPGGEVATVRAALERARDGDRIRVLAGVYREGPLTVERSVALVGEGWPVLDGAGEGGVLLVTADGVSIEGFVIRGAGVSYVRDHAGLQLEGARGCVVRGNRFEDNFFGVYLARVQGCELADNEITASGRRESASGNGIHLWNTSDVRITRNRVRGHRDGIYLEHTRLVELRENTAEDNLRYGLHFMFSSETSYESNVFRRNGAGVAVMYSRDVAMVGNRFEDNWGPAAYGLLLKEIADSEITGNTFRRNTLAIHSEGSLRVLVRRNELARNGWAVRVLANSQENRFSENNFVDNVFDVTTNSRHNFNVFDGNYWSKYDGYDLAGDGVGDVPHRPVRLFSLIVARHPTALVLLRTLFIDLLEVAERVLPVLTPETLVDENPRMRKVEL